MKVLKLTTDSIIISDAEYDVYKRLLKTLKIRFVSTEIEPNKIIKVCDLYKHTNTRIINTIKHYLEVDDNMNIKDFIEKYPSCYLLKCKNIGKKSIEDLRLLLLDQGYVW